VFAIVFFTCGFGVECGWGVATLVGGGTVGNTGDCDTVSIVVSGCIDMGRLSTEDDGVNSMSDSVVEVRREDSDNVAVETNGQCAAKRLFTHGWSSQ
jgi:hypothetical protein